MTASFIRAVPEDAAFLTEIAVSSKAHWGYSEHWMKEWLPQLTVSPDFVACHHVIVARMNLRAVGFYALSDQQTVSDLIHFWLLPAFIGQGLGRQMFDDAVDLTRGLGNQTIRIESDPHAEQFYLHLGATRVATVASTVDGHHRELPVLHYVITRP